MEFHPNGNCILSYSRCRTHSMDSQVSNGTNSQLHFTLYRGRLYFTWISHGFYRAVSSYTSEGNAGFCLHFTQNKIIHLPCYRLNKNKMVFYETPSIHWNISYQVKWRCDMGIFFFFIGNYCVQSVILGEAED